MEQIDDSDGAWQQRSAQFLPTPPRPAEQQSYHAGHFHPYQDSAQLQAQSDALDTYYATSAAAQNFLLHQRHNSLAVSTSSTDSAAYSDMSEASHGALWSCGLLVAVNTAGEHAFQPGSSMRSNEATASDAVQEAANRPSMPLRRSIGSVAERRTTGARPSMAPHPSGLVAPDTLLLQELHSDGRPRRPMNAYMIFAKHRRPEYQRTEPGLKTGELSKRLAAEWKDLDQIKKSFYLEQAKVLKDHFHERFPSYVYRRRANNQGRRRGAQARSTRGSSGSARGSSTDSSDSLASGNSPGSGSPGFSPVNAEFPPPSPSLISPPQSATYRLGSSLGSSSATTQGSPMSRSFELPRVVQMPSHQRHSSDFDGSDWPSTQGPTIYSSASSSMSPGSPSAATAYFPAYGLMGRQWEPTFARSYDGHQQQQVSRAWPPGYAADAFDARMQPYPSVAYAPLSRSSDSMQVSNTDQETFHRYHQQQQPHRSSLSMSQGLPPPSPSGSTFLPQMQTTMSRNSEVPLSSWHPPRSMWASNSSAHTSSTESLLQTGGGSYGPSGGSSSSLSSSFNHPGVVMQQQAPSTRDSALSSPALGEPQTAAGHGDAAMESE